MSVRIAAVETLRQLIEKAQGAGIKRALLTSYGSVEPLQTGGAWVLAGMTTVAATVLDPGARTIYRWEEKGRSKGAVRIRAGSGRGAVGGGEPMARLREDVFQLLRDEGFEVDEGEWTSESAERFLASRKRLIG